MVELNQDEKVEVVLRPEDLDITDIEHGRLRVMVESQLFLGIILKLRPLIVMKMNG
jgi:ABC-type Fe3+/spermidine/putrescine transport system ATPase subunit